MNAISQKAKEIFVSLVDGIAEAEREKRADEACQGDVELRRRVHALLLAHAQPDSRLEHAAFDFPLTVDRSIETTEKLGTLIGPYKLLEQIGEGGMGLVYMAEQQRPMRRLVALKLIKPGMDSKQVIARFEAEKQALAMMDHENIAKVFEAGTTDTGRFYFAMELVRGMPINEFCDQQRLSVRERLELFIQVCQAVQHAHQKGIIHRDLKPTNVLVTMNDIVAIPKVIDFGIAKALGQSLTDHTLHTGFAQLVGTPLYMSPEQAQMNQLGVDTRSDVYSLGVLLYELLTGTTPFDKETLSKAGLDEMRRMIREDDPPRPSARMSTLQAPALSTISQRRSTDPRRISTTLRGELDWIVMKALEKDRSRRYESASAFATDIQRYLSDEPVLACPPTTMYRFQKFARKHKPALATAAAIALCLILGTTVSAWQAVRATTAEAQANDNANKAQASSKEAKEKAQEATTQRDEAQRQRDEVKTLADRLQRTLYAANMKLAKNAWDEAAIPRVQELLERHRPKSGNADVRGFEWHYLSRLCDAGAHFTLKYRSDFLASARFSPDGKCLVTSSTGGTSSGKDVEPELKFWDSESGQELFTLKGGNGGMAFSPDGQRIAASFSERGSTKIWNGQTGQELLVLRGHTGGVISLAFSPDGKRLASGSGGVRTEGKLGEVKVWDAHTGQELHSISGDVRSVVFSPDGKRVAHGIGGRLIDGKRAEGTVKVWDSNTGLELLSLRGGGASVAFSPDGKLLVSRIGQGWGDDNRLVVAEELKVWDAQTGKDIPSLNEKSDGRIHFAFSPDGKRLAVAGVRSKMPRIKVCDTETGEEHFTFQRHTDGITDLDFSPDSKRLASSGDRTVRIWNLETGEEFRVLKGHTGRVSRVAFSPDGKRLASASGWDGTVKVWDVQRDLENFAIQGNHGVISPDFKHVASASSENTVKFWDARSGRETLTLKGHANNVFGLAFSPDGKRLASGDGTRPSPGVFRFPGVVKIWDTQTGRDLFSLKGHNGSIPVVAFSPDGKRLASRSWRGQPSEIKVWDVQSGQELLTIDHKGGGGWWKNIAFSPDGKRLASSGSEVKVWNAETGHEILTLKSGGGTVAFSPDGKRLATSSSIWDETKEVFVTSGVKVWNVESGEELLTYMGHSDDVVSIVFSPEGDRVASASRDGMVKVCDANSGEEMLTFGHVGALGNSADGTERRSHSVAFSADGHRLASVLWDGTVRIWDATPLPEKP